MILKQKEAYCQQQHTNTKNEKKNQKQNKTKITTNTQRENERTHKNFLKNRKTNFTEKGGMLSQTFIHRGLCKYDVGSELYRKVGNNLLLYC